MRVRALCVRANSSSSLLPSLLLWGGARGVFRSPVFSFGGSPRKEKKRRKFELVPLSSLVFRSTALCTIGQTEEDSSLSCLLSPPRQTQK